MKHRTTIGTNEDGSLFITYNGDIDIYHDARDFMQVLSDMFLIEDEYELLDVIDEAMATGQSIESLLNKNQNLDEYYVSKFKYLIAPTTNDLND